MGTLRFLLLWGCLTLLLPLMVPAHSQTRQGDNLDSVKRQISKNDRHTNRRNENKEVTRRTWAFSAEQDLTKLKLSKPRPGYLSSVSVLDTPNILDLSKTSLENIRRKRQSNGKKNGKPRKPCPGCYSPMARPQRQKRDLSKTSLENIRRKRQSNGKKNGKPRKPCPGCYSPMARPQRQKRDLEEREPPRKRGHKKPKDRKKGPPTRGLARSKKHEKEDSTGRRREREREEHLPGSLSFSMSLEEPRRPHGHHKKEKHGKHRKNHHHEHSDGKDEKEE
ncbi:uncharacterized protein XB22065621.S isoform X3 [Xenopus laevis]|uniref:Uncharacterized protein XB22065621.S isoform X3 n=1 Tax=Xenopus laevis TaxID=8355 RepID=A0A8J1L3R7_XENLA|nr:uncharacterized protein XB22065621.S isoform X3 [Xenopus laevis]